MKVVAKEERGEVFGLLMSVIVYLSVYVTPVSVPSLHHWGNKPPRYVTIHVYVYRRDKCGQKNGQTLSISVIFLAPAAHVLSHAQPRHQRERRCV